MKKISNFIKKEWILLLILAMGFAVSLYVYPMMPERVPSHWNFKGEIDGYSSRLFGAFGQPLIATGLYLMFFLLPYIDPKKANYKNFETTYQFFKSILVVFIMGIHGVILAAALGYPVNTGLLVKLGVALLILLMGNAMGRIKHNYFVGIKTPWTLASEEVWRRTHRMAGPMWVAAGAVSAVAAFIDHSASQVIFFVAMLAAGLIPCVYSYIIFRNLTKKSS